MLAFRICSFQGHACVTEFQHVLLETGAHHTIKNGMKADIFGIFEL